MTPDTGDGFVELFYGKYLFIKIKTTFSFKAHSFGRLQEFTCPFH